MVATPALVAMQALTVKQESISTVYYLHRDSLQSPSARELQLNLPASLYRLSVAQKMTALGLNLGGHSYKGTTSFMSAFGSCSGSIEGREWCQHLCVQLVDGGLALSWRAAKDPAHRLGQISAHIHQP